MTISEIKKGLYKQKPIARLRYVRKGRAYYYADLEEKRIEFKIPISDMGDADFTPNMDAKLLIRWLNAVGFFIKNLFTTGTIWSIKFECGTCGAISTVQHDDSENYHKCPACKTINILNKVSYY